MSRRRVVSCSGLCAAIVAGCVSVASAQVPAQSASAVSDGPIAAEQARPAPLQVTPPATSTATVPGIGKLLTSLGNDILQLPKRDNLMLIGIGSAAALAATAVDGSIRDAAGGDGALHEFLEPGQLVGGFYMQASGAVATYAIGRMTGSERTAQVGAELVRAQILTQVTTQFIKVTSTRTRPDGTRLSFPSGHTGATFATATVLQRNFGWKAGVPAYAVAAWVAASRVQMKRHYLSDVIAGATLGILAGRAVTVGKGENTFAITPTFVPGGAGITFTRVGGR